MSKLNFVNLICVATLGESAKQLLFGAACRSTVATAAVVDIPYVAVKLCAFHLLVAELYRMDVCK